MRWRMLWPALATLMFCACLFETRKETRKSGEFPEIRPDLAIGNQWMYRTRQFVESQDGTQGDTAGYFIHYEITGDSLIEGWRYRILVEEDLALFNTDAGLVKNRSAYALREDSSGLLIKALKGGDQATGRWPFKVAAAAFRSDFDTAHFRDEITALKGPFSVGAGWAYRAEGSPGGLWPATKIFLGRETLLLAGAVVSALKFQIRTENLEYVRTYEWYVGDVKVFSRSSTAANDSGKDSSRWEEEYLGRRGFSKADTQAVLEGSIFAVE